MNIRASMLPAYLDCSRRTAAKQFIKKFKADGYEFRQLAPSVGAAAGTAVHKGVEVALKARWSRRTPSADEILQPAYESFLNEVEPGAVWDETTPNASVAQQQIRTMISAYLNGPGKDLMPMTMADGQPAVELHLEADAGNGWTLTGTMDVTADDFVRDLKTGALKRPYSAQLGAYALLVRSNEVITDIKGLCIDFVKRAGKTKPQPQCETQEYPVVESQRYAMGIIHRIKKDMAEYEQDGNMDMAFMANPMSMMCGPKYCPCHGTKFCTYGGTK